MRPVRSPKLVVALVGLFAALLVAAVLLPVVLIHNDAALSRDQTLKARNDLRGSLIQTLAAVAVVAGATATWRGLQATRDGQAQDRLSNALLRLESEKPEARMAAIHDLTTLATREPDRAQGTLDVLVTYLHHTLPRTDAPQPPGSAGERRAAAKALRTLANAALCADLDLSVLDLREMDLSSADFRGANFARSDLRGAVLRGSRLQHAHLAKARLEGARAERANFEGANLTLARVADLHLAGARFDQRTKLTGANIADADASGAYGLVPPDSFPSGQA
ncbi:MAG TPA: pentapeptide repeat-containing protein [Baekduia sp.]|uniref:pentapeptide repeat-containing protein n=1 Tax=Baekduia sp. TaxID=2600305 RepID=UPI002D79F4B7|nr:pentapeptide repeat-containing protein [Baekduia sp.]HET6508776.1 pentapeptide repeat-containing protein [Baekduia sp.]